MNEYYEQYERIFKSIQNASERHYEAIFNWIDLFEKKYSLHEGSKILRGYLNLKIIKFENQ